MEDGGRLNAFATEPRMEVVEATQGWGFHDRAEKLNGRMAMLGFIALLVLEEPTGEIAEVDEDGSVTMIQVGRTPQSA